MNKPCPSRFSLSPVLMLAVALIILSPAIRAQDEQQEYRQYYVQWYWLVGTSVDECNANCVASCSPACYASAAAAGVQPASCPGLCPSECAAKCPTYFATTVPANDGLPSVPATNCESQAVCKNPTNPTYSPGTVGEWGVEPSTPSIEGGQPVSGPGISTGEPASDNGLTPTIINPPGGMGTPEVICPDTAPDGHPVRYSETMGCYDIYYKNDYCAQATTCNNDNPCTGRFGCIWNGAACVPCTSPSCVFTCPGTGRAPAYAQQNQIPKPVQLPAAAGENSAQNAPGQPSGGTTDQPTTDGTPVQQTPATPSQPTPNPEPSAPSVATAPAPAPVECGNYQNCTSCANAPMNDGRSQCGWSEFLHTCISGKAWDQINESGLKAGWVDNPKYCPQEQDVYCFRYSDCLSCAGKGGVKRRCQWSVSDSKCVPYDPTSDFRKNDKPDANNIIVPSLCPSYDCAEYALCSECEENAMCLWSNVNKRCVEFEGDGTVGPYSFYPGNCPKNESAQQEPAPAQACPQGCTCDKQMNINTCKGVPATFAGIVSPQRAALNAGAGSQLEQVDGITFSKAGKNSTYIIQGHRESAFLFIFPLTVNVTTTVNAQTGAIEKVDMPWWSFLAK